MSMATPSVSSFKMCARMAADLCTARGAAEAGRSLAYSSNTGSSQHGSNPS